MARIQQVVDKELVKKAEKELKRFRHHKIYMRLLMIVQAGRMTITDVAQLYDVSRRTVYRWITRFRERGVEGLFDQPRGHNPSKLNQTHKEKIAQWLSSGKNEQGERVHWTLERLRLEIKEQFDISISVMPLWRHVRRMGFRMKVPRPVHKKSDPKEQELFKKNG